MITRLAHVCLHTKSLDETAKFYCDTLGLDKTFEFRRDGKPFGFYLNLGHTSFIEVFEGDPGEVGNLNHLAIETEDIDAVITSLRNAGYTATNKKLGADHSWQSWTEDPSGVRIEFHQYTPDSLQLNGGVCDVNW